MKAIVKEKPEPSKDWQRGLKLIERETPTVQEPTDVKIRVKAAAICGTDVGIYNSKDSIKESMSMLTKPNVIIGHEFAGKVEDAGLAAKEHLARLVLEKYPNDVDVKNFVRERNVEEIARDGKFIEFLMKFFDATAEMHITCGVCYQCQLGERHVCRNTIIRGIHDDGIFAEYVVLPAENIRLYKLGMIPTEVIAFMDAIGNATHTVQSVDLRGKRVAILGCGVQGLMATAIAKFTGARRIYVTDASHGEFSHEKLETLRFRLARMYGADHTFDVNIDKEKERFYQTIKEETDDTGVDVVLEMSGNYKAYEDAFKVVRMGGWISLLGLPGGKMVVDFSRDVIFRGVTIHGVIGRRVWSTWDLMEKTLTNGLAQLFVDSGFITHQFPLEEYEQAFKVIMNGDALKVILRP